MHETVFVEIMMNRVICADDTSTASTDVQVSSQPDDKSRYNTQLLEASDVSAAVVNPITMKRSGDRLVQDGVKQQKTSLNLPHIQQTPKNEEPPFEDKGMNQSYTWQFV